MEEPQIRGLLLEEAVLYLLRQSGYRTVLSKGVDETLEDDPSGALFVRGRGTRHQIDAIADYFVQPPFSNPARLLVEAKFYDSTTRVGLTVVRNAAGTVNDVSEYFVPVPGKQALKRRYHYQYAVVSATDFSPRTQDYAYAHDIFLIPLGSSTFFKPLLDAIRTTAARTAASSSRRSSRFSLELRDLVRSSLQDVPRRQRLSGSTLFPAGIDDALTPFTLACQRIEFALVAVASGGFPVFLSPAHGVHIEHLENVVKVRIHRQGKGWLLARDSRESPLFSFDLPEQVAEMYAEGGELSPERAVDLKQMELNELQAVHIQGDTPRIIRFILDRRWLQALREQA